MWPVCAATVKRHRMQLARRLREAGYGLIIGLYLSRVVLEFAPHIRTPAARLAAFFASLALGFALGMFLHGGGKDGWPVLFLLPYLLYPTLNPRLALICGAMALLSFCQVRCERAREPFLEMGVFLAAFAVYTATLAPGVRPADAGEFQLVATRLGVAHPPGYPLYTMLAHAVTLGFPLWDAATRVNLFSAMISALTLVVLAHAVRRETGSAWAGCVAAATLGVATSFWAVSVEASIRPMTMLFTALSLDALLGYRRYARLGENVRMGRALRRFALWLGLGVTHHPSIAFPAIPMALGLIASDPKLVIQPRRWLKPILAGLVGTLPLLYLPWRSAVGAALAPPGLDTWDGFWHHVLAKGFAGDFFYFRTWPEVSERLITVGEILTFQWEPLTLIGALAALVLMLWRDRWLGITLGLSFGIHAVVTATYRAPQTVEYLGPAYVVLAFGVGWLSGARFAMRHGKAIQAVITSALLVAALMQGLTGWANRRAAHFSYEARDFAEALLSFAPEGATVLANWHRATPLWYLQAVEGLRQDVTAIYVWPEGAEPIYETWARRVRELAPEGPLLVQSYYSVPYAATGYRFEPLPGGIGWVVRDAPRRELPDDPAYGLIPMDVGFEGGIRLVGGPGSERGNGEVCELFLAWRTDGPTGDDVVGYVHLMDGERLIRQDDVRMRTSVAAPGEVILARYEFPRPEVPGRYELETGLYTSDPEGITAIPTDDGRQTLSLDGVCTGRYEGSSLPPPTDHPLYTPFADGPVLVGYDYDTLSAWRGRVTLYLHWGLAGWSPQGIWDVTLSDGERLLYEGELALTPGRYVTLAVDVPADVPGMYLALSQSGCQCLSRPLGAWGLPIGYGISLPGPKPGQVYVRFGPHVVMDGFSVSGPNVLAPGAEVHVALRFLADGPLSDDYVVSATLSAIDGTWWSNSDHIPATGAVPSLKWVWGEGVTDRHTLTVPEWADDPGGAVLTIRLYENDTGRVMPILERGGDSVIIATWGDE